MRDAADCRPCLNTTHAPQQPHLPAGGSSSSLPAVCGHVPNGGLLRTAPVRHVCREWRLIAVRQEGPGSLGLDVLRVCTTESQQ
jgi:hypothetical protein